MDLPSTERLRVHFLAGRRLHERWAAEKDRTLSAHDDRLIGHRGHVRAAGRAAAEHDGDLSDAASGEARLIEEDAPEVIFVGENLVLQGQVGAAGVDQIDAGQLVLERDLLRPQMLLHRDRKVGSALDGRIVRNDDRFASGHAADVGDETRGGRLVLIKPARRERGELEKWRAGVEQATDAIPRQQLPSGGMPAASLLAPTEARTRNPRAQIGDQGAHVFGVCPKGLARRLDARADTRTDPRADARHQTVSMASATASPPPMQSDAIPRSGRRLSSAAARRRSACTSVTRMRAPVAPIGWPSAQAPPFTLTRAGSSSRSCSAAMATAAKASLIS